MTAYYSVLQKPEDQRVRRSRMKAPPVSGGCFYCRCAMYPRGSAGGLEHPDQVASNDHYVPFTITATSGLPESRFVTACVRCNSLKGHLPAEIYQYFVRVTNMRQPANKLRAELTRFAFLLMATGFHVALREAKDAHAHDEIIPSFLPSRDQRGRFTLKDLRN